MRQNLPRRAYKGTYDTKHTIKDVGLKAGALLHRFAIIPPDQSKPVLYSAIYMDGEEVYNNPREKEDQMIQEWNTYGAETWEAQAEKDSLHKYSKVPGCIYSHKYGCKGCEHNEVPRLYDGGCKIMKPRKTLK